MAEPDAVIPVGGAQTRNVGKGTLVVVHVNMDESADIDDVAKDLRNYGPTVMAIACACADMARGLVDLLQRGPNAAAVQAE